MPCPLTFWFIDALLGRRETKSFEDMSFIRQEFHCITRESWFIYNFQGTIFFCMLVEYQEDNSEGSLTKKALNLVKRLEVCYWWLVGRGLDALINSLVRVERRLINKIQSFSWITIYLHCYWWYARCICSCSCRPQFFLCVFRIPKQRDPKHFILEPLLSIFAGTCTHICVSNKVVSGRWMIKFRVKLILPL